MNGSRNKLGLFESATWRLTAWYMALLMTLSLIFSVVLFEVVISEVNRALGPIRQGEPRLFVNDDTVIVLRQQRIDDSTARLIVSLVIFNLSVLVGGTALSYLLAKRTLRPVEQAHEAQVQFASDAAHELKTPLAVMQTEIEVSLRDKKATRKSRVAILESALEEISRLRILTDRLLKLATQRDMIIGTVDVEAAVVEAITRVVPLAQARQMTIDNRVGVSVALGNQESVVDIVGILLDNAIKYAPKKTTITLSSLVRTGQVEIMIADEGYGIAKDEREKIFERFYRADRSRSKENVEGHGLGLSLAKRLAEEMQGVLRVEDNFPKGAIFTLTLPHSAVQ